MVASLFNPNMPECYKSDTSLSKLSDGINIHGHLLKGSFFNSVLKLSCHFHDSSIKSKYIIAKLCACVLMEIKQAACILEITITF